MTRAADNPQVDAIIAGYGRWREEMKTLREIVRECPLAEEVKWGQPCYTLDGANVVIIHGFKNYCALLFIKGALMKDPANLLIQQTANVQSGRQIRFTDLAEIAERRATLKAYVEDAIAVEKAGLKIEKKKASEFAYPEELQARLAASNELKTAFEALTRGRRRAYLLHFADAKQAKTRHARIEKCVARILAGKGLDD
jgi:uncharacterized protein YdeI (YjbR/CyaY-like superfamily)